ncbi:hypothetical protein ACHAW5_006681 [Stephanodiscus triporus]|uniref:Extracellular membrane protein CFEM domain-containing protein n=1 Tax=Stephanodiscus triporus TaxID=2934178 RepID=A0ABD3MCY9_9STRA
MNLALAAIAIVVLAAGVVPASASASSGRRRLQAESIACLVGGDDYATCCPSSGPDPDDGVCTLLTCLELEGDISLRDACACEDVVAACDQVAMFASVVDELPDMCASVSGCCGGEEGVVDNATWDSCMAEAEAMGNHTLPDFSVLIPGGLPLIEGGVGPVIVTTTVAPGDIDIDMTTMIPMDLSSTTGATEAAEGEVSVMPPPSVVCLAGQLTGVDGSSFLDCCPSADPDDGICTMLWCVDLDTLAVKDGCACDQVETSCGQLAGFESMVTNLAEACVAVSDCCTDEYTSSEDYNACMSGKGLTPPDLESLVPGGLPEELGGGGGGGGGGEEGEGTATVTDATEVPPAEEEEGTTTTVPPPSGEAPVASAGQSFAAALTFVVVLCSSSLTVVLA